MLDEAIVEEVKKGHAAHADARRELIKLASDAQSASKRAIFALHRDDPAGADALLAEAEDRLREIGRRAAVQPALASEGSYRAALEEYAEAALYRQYVERGAVGKVPLDAVGHDAYLGGLADLAGELQRRQVRMATEGRVADVKALKDAIEEIVTALLSLDLEGYLRTKFDQAKNGLRRAEDVYYEVSLRSKG
jgi:predicted translin family RNA/ssDNA-binding protein